MRNRIEAVCRINRGRSRRVFCAATHGFRQCRRFDPLLIHRQQLADVAEAVMLAAGTQFLIGRVIKGARAKEMKRSGFQAIRVLAFIVALLGLASGTEERRRAQTAPENTDISQTNVTEIDGKNWLPAGNKFDCLSKDVQLDEVVSWRAGKENVTVERKLAELRARCRKQKLVDGKGREIRFFHPSCWGNPPPDYLEIKTRENEQLQSLKKRYTVIAFSCNPMIQ